MNNLITKTNSFLYNEFVFAPRYRLLRHTLYWSFHVIVWSVFWVIMGSPASFARNLFNMSLWVPVFVFFGYPLVYVAVPMLLLKGKVWQFFVLVLVWGAAGIYINAGFRTFLYIPLQEFIGFSFIPEKGFQPHSYLCMTTSAASPMIIRFFKLWTVKQRAWMQAKQEQMTTELQLLKAHVHPHFLFNTLSNIYSFSIEKSPKTPGLILKLSSLLSYMLYDCKAEEVPLGKEIEMMKNYIDLEKDRYEEQIDISVNIQGEVQDEYIAPLLILPFLENAFKHGTSGQPDKAWMSVDIAVKDSILKCKVVNSKSQVVTSSENNIGISNVNKRLEFFYPGRYDLKVADEGDFFVVSLLLHLRADAKPVKPVFASNSFKMPAYEVALSSDR